MEHWKWRLALLIFGMVTCVPQLEGAQKSKQPSKAKTKESQVVAARPKDARAAACVTQIGPDEEEEASFYRKEIPETDKGKCLLACYLESKGVLSGGKFSSSGAAKIAARAYPNNAAKTGNVKHILSHCGTIAARETEQCQLAYRLAECTTTLADKFKL
uniref:Odorant-binding protein 34 n=1 Tax=Apolygus lucorum TaxID=248454 RepID=A0A142FHA1_APOLU|nr:odorant-binding protein 34 [Apolygus lucorum]